jgi:SynChlorMet cassette protein ScmD
MMRNLKVNPDIVLREEYDDAGILFNPDDGKCVGLSPTAVFIWKILDGNHTKDEILKDLNAECTNGIPKEAPEDYDKYIAALQEKGYLSV